MRWMKLNAAWHNVLIYTSICVYECVCERTNIISDEDPQFGLEKKEKNKMHLTRMNHIKLGICVPTTEKK